MKTLLMILLVLPFVTACVSGPSKGQLDDEVRRLCAIDGGIKVYETVKLPAEKFDQYGQIRIPTKNRLKAEDDYYYEYSTSYLLRGNPEMVQYHFKLYRQLDNKLLGEAISYSRRGGDMPGPWLGTAFLCPEKTDISDLKKQVFVRK